MRLQTLSEMIRHHRKEVVRMSVRTYADKVGLSRATIMELERGAVRNPCLETMDKLSAFMGRPKADLWAALRREIA